MARKTLTGKTGSQAEVVKGATGETAAQITAAVDAIISNDTKATGGKENSLIKVKVPVFNGYFTYTYLPELFFEQLGADTALATGGVPDDWGQLIIKQKSETTPPARNKRPPGDSKAKRRVTGKLVKVPLTEGNEIVKTNVGKSSAERIIRQIFLRFPSICPHAAIAIWLSKVIAAGKMPPIVI
ncbi:MAG TPA: hypothetical protein VFM18_23285, partial [Methanosarcina sp.]|nr:hypothetical protein [Methanosarcina sp.]